jgi:hypothetical protein
MIYPDVDVQEWCEHYRITIKIGHCLCCGKELMPSIPFAHKDWRGVTSAPHGCPERYDHKWLVSVDKDRRAFWANLHTQI